MKLRQGVEVGANPLATKKQTITISPTDRAIKIEFKNTLNTSAFKTKFTVISHSSNTETLKTA